MKMNYVDLSLASLTKVEFMEKTCKTVRTKK